MITEDYVSFEIAKHLKEKGFDGPCYAYWCEDENKIINSQSPHAIKNDSNPCFFGPAAPTIQMAMKWLREVHKLFIEVKVSIDLIGNPHYAYSVLGSNGKYKRESYTSFDWTFEKACEEAIKYCLENLI